MNAIYLLRKASYVPGNGLTPDVQLRFDGLWKCSITVALVTLVPVIVKAVTFEAGVNVSVAKLTAPEAVIEFVPSDKATVLVPSEV